jgi:glyoxylase-like metal-dependent hydrolase (beta-lactamase superfamily II)
LEIRPTAPWFVYSNTADMKKAGFPGRFFAKPVKARRRGRLYKDSMALEIHTIVSMPFEENTYIVWRPGRNDALVIDPGLEPDAILAFLDEQSLAVAAILDTHGHADHIAGNEALKNRYPQAPLVIGVNDTALLADPNLNLSAPFGFAIVSPPADLTVREGDTIEFAGISLEVREIPGHSPGHIVFVVRETPIVVLGGDVLFRGSVGRCDFPGGDFPLLEKGIRTKLYTLPDDTVVYPGHGPVTTVGHEKKANPFVRP